MKKATIGERRFNLQWRDPTIKPIEVFCPYCGKTARRVGDLYKCPWCREYFSEGDK